MDAVAKMKAAIIDAYIHGHHDVCGTLAFHDNN
jgi:hypothetical protein